MFSYLSNNVLSLPVGNLIWSRNRNARRPQRGTSTIQFAYQALEARKLLASLVGDFVDDFNSEANPNWEYYWNSTGSLADPNDFEALNRWVFPASGIKLLTPGGGAIPNVSPASRLYLGAGIGHPGAVGHYAMAGFTIEDSGYYSIEDSFVSVNNSFSDGIEFKVFVDSGPLLNEGTVVSDGDSKSYFDTELGFLATGSEVFVAFGAGASDAYDSFSHDFSIFRHDDREIVVEPTQNSSGGTWEHTVENSGLYGVRDTTADISVNATSISNGDSSLGYLKQGVLRES